MALYVKTDHGYGPIIDIDSSHWVAEIGDEWIWNELGGRVHDYIIQKEYDYWDALMDLSYEVWCAKLKACGVEDTAK